MKNILITGGLGYIGTHIIYKIMQDNLNYNIIVIDNLSNSSIDILKEFVDYKDRIQFIECDCRNKKELDKIFLNNNNIYAVIHLAGFKSVENSVSYPILYYDNNINCTINLIKIMSKYNCCKLIFSSSASIYGNPKQLPITESTPLNPISPYAKTKYFQEILLKDVVNSDINWSIFSLRYFNPIGSINKNMMDKSRTNIMPNIIHSSEKNSYFLKIFGKDYNTPDGTAIRDYIHILDLAEAHIKALHELDNINGFMPLNLGIGKGYSVLELIEAFNKKNENKINYVFTNRRQGDVESIYCSYEKAKKELNWEPKYNIYDMVKIN